MNKKLEVIKSWFRRVWKEEDASAIDDMFIPDGKARGLGSEPLTGPEQFKGFHGLILSLIKDIEIKIDRHMEKGDWISTLVVVTGTGRGNAKPVEMSGNVWVRIVDGKLVEAHNHFDFLKMFEQLELIHPGRSRNAFAVKNHSSKFSILIENLENI